ncbi:hypothetical protein BDV06DRAFT_216246 [Aspergillus oleicola]
MTNYCTPNEGQLSQLPGLTHYITGYDQNRRGIIQQERPAGWREFGGNLNNDVDIAESSSIRASPDLGLIHPGGIVCRIVDFVPGNDVFMHRSQSLDYGVVLGGTVELVMDSGDVRTLRRGDVANPSNTEWTRLAFFMQSSEPVEVGDTVLKEDFGGSMPDQLNG